MFAVIFFFLFARNINLQNLQIDNARFQILYDNAEKRVGELSGQLKEFQEKLFALAEEGQNAKPKQNTPPSS